jgi:hypothetical protein
MVQYVCTSPTNFVDQMMVKSGKKIIKKTAVSPKKLNIELKKHWHIYQDPQRFCPQQLFALASLTVKLL